MGFKKFISNLFQSPGAVPYEFTSNIRLFGLPFLPVNIGFDIPDGKMRTATGIIAIGIQARGIIVFGETVRSIFRH